MKQISSEEWSVSIETSGELIYKFISDSMHIMNDPHAENYIEIEGQGIWSKVKESQSKMKRRLPNVKNICICKDIDDNYNPIESTNIIKPVDNLMICHTEITNISENFLVSMFWKDEIGIVFAAIDDLVKFDGRKERIVFTGVNIKYIINTNIFQNGKFQVEVFINGVFSSKCPGYVLSINI